MQSPHGLGCAIIMGVKSWVNGKMILGDKKITVEKNPLIYTGNLCRRRRQAPESYNIKNRN